VCTASWICESDGFELFFNRDEQRTRPAALPPRVDTVDGVQVLAPRDGQEHGTWIGANEHGLVVCLLNLYEVDYAPAAPRSRGHLVMELSSSRDLVEFERRVAAHDLVRYRGFTLLAFDAGSAERGNIECGRIAVRWDGERATRTRDAALAPPLVSSGFDLPGVRASRLATWSEVIGDAPSVAALERFHGSRGRDDGAYDVAMSRPDACTVSHTRVRVTNDAVRMRYLEGAPTAQGGPVDGAVHELVLARRAPARP